MASKEYQMPFELPALPWASDALEPHLSAKTIGFHHGKHHNAYITNLNNLVDGSPLAEKSLTEIVKGTAGDASKAAIFNNAAQAWNHDFFWKSMKAGGSEPQGKLLQAINDSFGSYDKFREQFAAKAVTLFGSGWTWLVADGGKLEIIQTAGAGNPMTAGKTPLLTLDVWEHAYYLDYQNRRPDFIAAFLGHLVNWDFAERNLG
jgi:Fe-Mn family superoxide dismutase